MMPLLTTPVSTMTAPTWRIRALLALAIAAILAIAVVAVATRTGGSTEGAWLWRFFPFYLPGFDGYQAPLYA